MINQSYSYFKIEGKSYYFNYPYDKLPLHIQDAVDPLINKISRFIDDETEEEDIRITANPYEVIIAFSNSDKSFTYLRSKSRGSWILHHMTISDDN